MASSAAMDVCLDAKLLADALDVSVEHAAAFLSGTESAEALAGVVNNDVLTHAHLAEMCKTRTITEPLLVALIPKAPENVVPELAKLMGERKDAEGLAKLLADCREGGLFRSISRAKATKCVRAVLDEMTRIEGSQSLVMKCTRECIEWAKANHQAPLRQRLELRLCGLLLSAHDLEGALTALSKLLVELRKLDDKPMLVEALLLESAIQREMHNLPKAKAALTGARTNANAIYCPQKLQAELDLQSGIVNADEKDYRTAFSYFFEACEGFQASNDARASQAFGYMLLAKIMSHLYDDIGALVAAKNAQAFLGSHVEAAMQAVNRACKDRALHAFIEARETYKDVLGADAFIVSHLELRYNALLEENLQRIIEPFSCVEVAHVAALIELPLELVERRLSQMILDKKIDGILDQGAGTLIVFDRPPSNMTYNYMLDTVLGLNSVVDRLYDKAVNLLA